MRKAEKHPLVWEEEARKKDGNEDRRLNANSSGDEMRGVVNRKSSGKKNVQREARNEGDRNKNRKPAEPYCNTDQ